MVEMVDTLINGNWSLLLPKHRADREEWSSPAGWERERLDAMHESIAHCVGHLTEISNARQGGLFRPLILDIGAEEGDFAGLFAKWGADVFMVEPNPRVWPNIRAIFEANKFFPHVEGYYVGLCSHAPNRFEGLGYDTAERDGWPEVAFGPIIGDHGFVSLRETVEHQASNRNTILTGLPITTIDNIVENIQRGPHFITMDVEGAELRVLQGAEETLKFFKPEVFVSLHRQIIDYDYGQSADDLLRFMKNLGYTCEWLATDHEEHWRFWVA